MRTKYPLFRLSEHLEEALFLIREQLKSRRFFNALRSLGLSDTSGEVHLEALIVYTMRLDNGSDEIMTFVTDLLDKHSQDLTNEPESIDKSALEVYCELLRKAKSVE